jgi:hypothetical protein
MDEFQDQIGALADGEIVVNTRDGWMAQSSQDVGFTLEDLEDILADEGVGDLADHLFDRHKAYRLEVLVASAVDGPHATHADNFLDLIAILEDVTLFELGELAASFSNIQIASGLIFAQRKLLN